MKFIHGFMLVINSEPLGMMSAMCVLVGIYIFVWWLFLFRKPA